MVDKKFKSVTIGDKRYLLWVSDLVTDMAYTTLTTAELCEKYNKSKSQIYNYKEDPNILNEVKRLKDETIDNFKQNMTTLVKSAFKVYEEVLFSADTDATRLKAAETVLKSLNIIQDKSKLDVELSGQLELPQIFFTSDKVEDDQDEE